MPPIEPYITTALSGLISAATLAVATWLVKQLKELATDFATLKESQRNQLKNTIVHVYEVSEERGYITPMELETCNRNADSYFDLGGNNYVHAIMYRLNNDMPIRGGAIPHEIDAALRKRIEEQNRTLTAEEINRRMG